MELALIDWIIIIAFLLLSLIIGVYYKNQAGKSLSDFFLGGRNLPWYLAGISMVATTFAADTPLAVSELVSQNGISGNWLWWNMLIAGMLTTFFFAKLWRRAEILTELEFITFRYSGKKAHFLRRFNAVYLGIFMNCMIIGWVNLAMMELFEVFFGIDPDVSIWYVLGAMIIAVIYSGLSGLKGVVITDVVQFVVAMVGTIVLAVLVLNSSEIGGISGLKNKLPESYFHFFPNLGSTHSDNPLGQVQSLVLPIGAFLSFVAVQWWASWYPGAEPGGGGYVAQRMMSTRSEKDSVFATLLFQIGHYCLRPWPWIIVGLCAVALYSSKYNFDDTLSPQIAALKQAHPDSGSQQILYNAFPLIATAYKESGVRESSKMQQIIKKGAKSPEDLYLFMPELKILAENDPDLAQSLQYEFSYKSGYVMVMKDFLPPGLAGLLLVAFIAAYLSTISTQLNWGASFLVNDFYLPLRRKELSVKSQIISGRVATALIMIVGITITPFLSSIAEVWNILLQCGAGLGAVLILRWYWWRINAWSQIAATITPFIGFLINSFWLEEVMGPVYIAHKGPLLFNVFLTTIVWLTVTYLTRPTDSDKLDAFYRKIKPQGSWKPVEKRLDLPVKKGISYYLLGAWLSSVIMIYSVLFASGKIIFAEWKAGLIWILISFISFLILRWTMNRSGINKN